MSEEKERLDILLVEKGLFESREKPAQALWLARFLLMMLDMINAGKE